VRPPQAKLPAVSTFSSAGIGDYGYRFAGFSFKVHAELRSERLEYYKLNHPRSRAVLGDLRTTWHDVVDEYRAREGREAPALLTGMSPCQGMSPSTHHEREGRSRQISKDPRNTLPFVLVDVARELRPLSIVVENVPGIVTTRVRDSSSGEVGTVASLLAKKLDGYACYPITLQFADYGIPQRRQRTLLTFLRSDLPCISLMRRTRTLPYPRKTHDRSSRFGRLAWLPACDFLGPPRFRPLSSFSEGRARDPLDQLHYVPIYDRKRFELVRRIPSMSGRSAYQNDRCPSCDAESIPEGIASCPACEAPLFSRPIVLDSAGPRLITGHKTSYQRMCSDLPVGTITTSSGHLGSDAKIHPWENRLLSPRECMTVQTIPATFRFGKPQCAVQTWLLRQTIGEAIPPWFTFLHGLVLRSLLGAGNAAKILLSETDYDVEDLTIESVECRGARRRLRRGQFASREAARVKGTSFRPKIVESVPA
jgi:DNA (cytosine-5)-methyltransferase 1